MQALTRRCGHLVSWQRSKGQGWAANYDFDLGFPPFLFPLKANASLFAKNTHKTCDLLFLRIFVLSRLLLPL
jgi:hypothetical protein